jgi:hypothetical protein
MKLNPGETSWRRVSNGNPCPICEHTGWCSVSADGAICVCMRKPEGSVKQARNGGHVHLLAAATGRRASSRTVSIGHSSPSRHDLPALVRNFQAAVNPVRLQRLADGLGLSVESLRRLDVGWAFDYRAWAFPMTDAAGRVLGIRLRLENGQKLSVRGGREGLFIPTGLAHIPGRLFITEGPTDAAALLDLGLDAVGRPSCTGGVRLLTELVQSRRPGGVVVVADADEPGQRGAEALAAVLALYCGDVHVITPPRGLKDARAWKVAGATAEEVQAAADAATRHEIKIFSKGVGRGV